MFPWYSLNINLCHRRLTAGHEVKYQLIGKKYMTQKCFKEMGIKENKVDDENEPSHVVQ